MEGVAGGQQQQQHQQQQQEQPPPPQQQQSSEAPVVPFVPLFQHAKVLPALAELFARLHFSAQRAVRPNAWISAYTDSNGAPINPRVQQDAQEFFNELCDRIDRAQGEAAKASAFADGPASSSLPSLLPSSLPSSLPRGSSGGMGEAGMAAGMAVGEVAGGGRISDLLGCTMVSQLAGQGGSSFARETKEAFTPCVSLDVRSCGGLVESLRHMVGGELIDGFRDDAGDVCTVRKRYVTRAKEGSV
jgi:hypothetical protein